MTSDPVTRPTRPSETPKVRRERAFAALGLGLSLHARVPASGGDQAGVMPDHAIEAIEALTAPDSLVDRPEERLQALQPAPVEALPAAVLWRPAPGLAGTLDELAEQVAACQACDLCKTRTRTVFAAGNAQADLAIVGEAPGAEEDRTGLPFVGNAGKLLDSMLASLSLRREEHAYICNVLKCRPPNNRDPLPEEVAQCEPYLQQQLAIVRPKMILVVGRFAAQSLLKTQASIASLRGRVHGYQVAERRIPVVVTYHPAYLLRNLPDKAKAWSDLCLLKAEMERIGS